MSSIKDGDENEAVTNFREYLRIPTVHPDVDYSMYTFYFIHCYKYEKTKKYIYFL